jgi:uncharacterized membrane protein
MTWFALSLGAALCFAVGQILVKKGFEHIPPLWNNIVNNLLALVFWIPFAILLNDSEVNVPGFEVFLTMLAAATLYQFFFYSISKGRISLTGTVVAAYPVFTVVLSLLFLDERLGPLQYVGIASIIGGGVVVAVPEDGTRKKGSSHDAGWLLWGFAGAFTIGVGDFLIKTTVNAIGAHNNAFFLALIFNFLSAVNYLVDRRNRKAPAIFSKRFAPTLSGICLHLIGAILFWSAMGLEKISLVGPVSSIYPAIVAVLAVKFLKERISAKHGTGIGITILGLILVGVGGI